MNNLNHNDIITRLCQAGYPTYLVGGAIRDLFAGFEPADFDITTLATPEQIAEVFAGRNVGTFGKTFGVTLVDGIDVATFRYDTYPDGNGAKKCIVQYADNIHSDLARRDLTINSLALCPITGDVIDNHGGRKHLQKGILQFVGNPVDRINEDPNRIIRACRFLSKFEGVFESNTLNALQVNAHLVGTHVDLERIGIEIKKALELPQPSLFFSALHLIGALQYVFPGLENCVDHEHGKWHKETVWEHLLLAGDKVSPRFPLIRLAAFLHDAGKPASFARNSDGTFVGHEVSGSDVVNNWLAALKFSNEERAFVVGLVRSHMWGGSDDISPKAVRKLRFKLNELGVDVHSWLRLRIADRHANLIKDDFSLRDIIERARRVGATGSVIEDAPFTVHALALKGGDIIKIFKLKPGRIVSHTQKHLLDFVVENGSEFNTVEALTNEAAFFINAYNS